MKEHMDVYEVRRSFWRDIAPGIPKNDRPAIRQAFNDYTDALCKDGTITATMYATITLQG